MKIYAVQLISKPVDGDPFMIKGAYDLNQFGYFQRQRYYFFLISLNILF